MDRGVKTKTPTIVMTRDTEMKFDESNPLLIRTIDEAQVKAVNIAKIMLIIMLDETVVKMHGFRAYVWSARIHSPEVWQKEYC